MKKILVVPMDLTFLSCSLESTQEQNEAYNACRETIIDNKVTFLDLANSEAGRDSAQDYYDKIEKNNLDELISDLDIEQEQVNILIYSVCAQAEKLKSIEVIKKELLRTDSLLKDIESKE